MESAIAQRDLRSALIREGRNGAPKLLVDRWARGDLTVEELRALLGETWCTAEWPLDRVDQDTWVAMFRDTGFLTDADLRPPENLAVYRGTTWGRRRGMSWTTDQSQAEWFAKRLGLVTGTNGLVFTTTVTPPAVLAMFGGSEREVVVDPTLLDPIRRSSIIPVTEAEAAARTKSLGRPAGAAYD